MKNINLIRRKINIINHKASRSPNSWPFSPSRTKSIEEKAFKAQGMVEFALVLPILLLLVLGVIEFGRYLFVVSAVSSASREAARYGSAVGESTPTLLRYQDYNGIVAAAKRIGSIAGINASNVTIKFDHGPGTSVYATCTSSACNPTVHLGDRIVVEVTRSYSTMVPLVNLPGIPIKSSSARTIVVNVPIQ